MKLEYVLIEKKNDKTISADKERIKKIFEEIYEKLDDIHIFVRGKRKLFEIKYKITCGTSTSGEKADFIYNITFEFENKDKMREADVLEKTNILFQNKIDELRDYFLIVANDGISTFYCNKIYPKYQNFERQLRHLIFKVVTRAYGCLWTSETLSEEMKRNLKEEIKTRNGNKKADMLIQEALHEMTMGQLIEYLFYGQSEIVLPDYIDEHLPIYKLKKMSKDELIALLEKGRRKSVWNLYLSEKFDIDEPKTKLRILKNNRNKVAHCKQFYYEDYELTAKYIDIFLPEINKAIEEATFQDPIEAESIVYGFGEFAVDLVNVLRQCGQALEPVLLGAAQLGNAIYQTYNSEVMKVTRDVIGESILAAANYIRDLQLPIKTDENKLINLLPDAYLSEMEETKCNFDDQEITDFYDKD